MSNEDLVATVQPDRACLHNDCAAFACQRETPQTQRPWLYPKE